MNKIKKAAFEYFKFPINIINDIVDTVGGILSLFFFSFVELFHLHGNEKRLVYRECIRQVYFTGVLGLRLMSVIALILGFIVTFYLEQFKTIVTPEIRDQILIIVIIREFGPLLTSIMIIARSGTAISAEISSMVVHHEMEALEAIGADTLRIILLPRFIGIMISMLCLNILFDSIGIFGGLFASKLLNPSIAYFSFIKSFFTSFSTLDIMIIAIKSFILGGIVSVTSVYAGFKTIRSRLGVIISTQRGIVMGFIWVFFFNGIITLLFYVSQF